MEYKDVKQFTVKRSSWHRGQCLNGGYLLDSNESRCVLGFYAQACGIPDEKIRNVGMPANVVRDKEVIWDSLLLEGVGYAFRDYNSKIAMDLSAVNDRPSLSEEDRENILIRLFKNRMGVDVTFED